MAGISPFLDICHSETFTAKTIMGNTANHIQKFQPLFIFPRENHASAEILEQKAGIFAYQFNGF
jgi:hypothetical protein